MPSTSRNLLIIFFLTVLARIVFHYFTGYVADDAYITFRYAENLAAGEGFVYNAGQHVLGTSTPFFTLLLALLTFMGMSVVKAALTVSVAASGLTAMVLYRFAQSLRFTRFAWFPALAYILWPRSIPADVSGMETAVFALFVISAFYFQHKRLDIYAIGMATLASVTRPEGLGLVILLVLYNWYRRPERAAYYLLIPLILLVPWLTFSHFYFGSIIPNSVLAKLALYSHDNLGSLWSRLVFIMAFHTPIGWALLVASLSGGYWLYKKQNFGGTEIAWLVAVILFYTFSRTVLFFWYVAPIYPLYLLFGTAALPFACDRWAWLARRWRVARIVIGTAMVVLVIIGNVKPFTYYHDLQILQLQAHKAIGIYLSAKASPEQVVAAEDIGYMGFYSKLTILDRDGLVSPQVIPYNEKGEYEQIVLDFRPDWVVAARPGPYSGFITDSLFLARYVEDTAFSAGSYEYCVFERKSDLPSKVEQLLDNSGS